jgi:predicted acylesterase/phospholipase RssA
MTNSRFSSSDGTGRQLSRRRILAITALAVVPGGCITPRRLPAAPAGMTAQSVPPVANVRFITGDTEMAQMAQEAEAALAKERAWRASIGDTGPLPPVSYLAISGGGDLGAFGAGVLCGWTAAGTRPEFKVVTGISTGALSAPFAFLGSGYDEQLKAVYTMISQRDIFAKRGILSAILSDALADTRPLYRTVSRFVTPELLTAVAAEYGKGRLLLVGTTDLDTRQPVIWNMTAIAASGDPDALELFRKVLLASAAIPAAFPPVMIDVDVGGKKYQEMHVDGGTSQQVFVYPPNLKLKELTAARGLNRKRTLYIIRNARLDPDWASVDRRTLSIAGRAVATLIQTQGDGDLSRIYLTSRRDGIDYRLAYIPGAFNLPHTRDFDRDYMRALFNYGYQMSVQGYPWETSPPGFDVPAPTPKP